MKRIVQLFGICFLVMAGFFTAVTFKALFHIPATLSRLEETVWLEDGRYDPANEGKLVTMVFDPNTLGPARDPDLGLTFNSPVVKRFVEEFAVRQSNLSGEGVEWWWKPVSVFDDRELRYRAFAGTDTGAEVLSLDPAYHPMLPAGREIGLSDMTPESQSRVEELFDSYPDGGYLWFSDAPAVCFGEDLTLASHLGGYRDYEGCIRVRYAAAFDEPKTVAVTGIQEGKTLVRDESLDLLPVAEGVTSYDGLIRDTVFNGVAGSLLGQLGVLFLLYFGLKWLGVIRVGVMGLLRRQLEKSERGRVIAGRIWHSGQGRDSQ